MSSAVSKDNLYSLVKKYQTRFKHKHLLSISQLDKNDIQLIVSLAQHFVDLNKSDTKPPPILQDKIVINFFLEPSTRTKISFDFAAKRLDASIIDFFQDQSSLEKGETVNDTTLTINAMRPHIMVARHQYSGASELLARHLNCTVINAGDGAYEHPTQALLDVLTLQQLILLKQLPDFPKLRIAICGDILHSRVARSNIDVFRKLGSKLHLIGPPTLLPPYAQQTFQSPVFYNLQQGIENCHVIMLLRLQNERSSHKLIPSYDEYYRFFGINHNKLIQFNPDAFIMHPGPVNRGVEIDYSIPSSISLIFQQVEMGVAIRMAILSLLNR